VSEPAYAIRRSSRARRARLTVTTEGAAIVVLPVRAPQALARELVLRHRQWLAKHQQRIAQQRDALADRPALTEGRLLPLRGTDHRLAVHAANGRRRPTVTVAPGVPPEIGLWLPPAQTESARAVLERWLRDEARRDLELAVQRRAAEMGLAAPRVSVRDQRTRWGSASRRGTLSFSWRLVLCPPEVLEYVVVHELAHLRWAGHGPRFWALVRRHAPNADVHRRWLRQHHAAIRAALD
jgi:predicted metal-dependent hydrolase